MTSDKSDNVYAAMDWDDKTSTIIPLTIVREPRKDIKEYEVGERITSPCPGWKGLFQGVIAAIDSDRQWLKERLYGPRPIQPKDQANGKKREKVEKKIEQEVGTSEKKTTQEVDRKSGVKRKLQTENRSTSLGVQRRPEQKDIESSDDGSVYKPMDEEFDSDGSSSSDIVIERPKNKMKRSKVEDQAKQAKKEENKDKREKIQEREAVNRKTGHEILGNHENKKSAAELVPVDDMKRMFNMFNEYIVKVEKMTSKMENYTTNVEKLLSCRSCCRKVYKSISDSSINVTPKQDVHKPATRPSTSVINVTPNQEVKPASSVTCEAEDVSFTDILNQSSEEADKMNKGCATDGSDGLSYVGDCCFGVQIKADDLHNCMKTAKTAEKLALNLIEFVLSKDDIMNSTVYGNKQHGKTAIPVSKRKAIRSQVFSCFHQQLPMQEKQKEWEKIVDRMNDKIRKLRTGKYKNVVL